MAQVLLDAAGDLLNIGATNDDNLGDLLRDGALKLKQWMADQNAMNTELYARVGTGGAGVALGGLTATQLDIEGLAAVGGSAYPMALSTDQGLQAFIGSSAVNANVPYIVLESAIDFVLQPSGTVNANGALVLDTTNPLLEIYDGCWMLFPSGKAYAGSYAGWYWVVMTSTSVGTIYDNTYMDGLPLVPPVLKGIIAAGPGAYTQIVGQQVQGPTGNGLGGVMGLNGGTEYRYTWSHCNSTGGAKLISPIMAGQNVAGSGAQSGTTTPSYHEGTTVVRNRGKVNSQRGFVSGTTQPIRLTVDTSRNFAMSLNLQITTATDWMALHSYAMTQYPVGIIETPAPQIYIAASPTIVPPMARDIGLTAANLQHYILPQAEDVAGWSGGAFTNSTFSLFNAGIDYKSQPPFTTACIRNVPMFNRAKALAFKFDAQNTLMSICSQTQTRLANAMGYNDNNKKWALEVSMCISDNHPDHWPAVWGLPQKHGNGLNPNYIERDYDEQGLVAANRGQRTFCGCIHSNLRQTWNGTSYTTLTRNNTQAASEWGMSLDRTKLYTIGYSWDPATHLNRYYLNGRLQWTFDETADAAFSNGDLYYLILSVQSHGLLIPYEAYFEHIAIYQGP